MWPFQLNHPSQTLSRRLIQEEGPGEDERVVAKLKTMRNLVSKIVDLSPTALSSSTSHSPETLKAKSSSLDLTSTGKSVARDSNENAASSSQAKQSDVNSSVSAGKLAAETTKNPVATRLLDHNTTMSPNNVVHLQKLYFERTTKTWSSTGTRHA